ncbi:MAG: efflux RND transporter periplasmic adaptor subunit [Chloroflexota bacterium]
MSAQAPQTAPLPRGRLVRRFGPGQIAIVAVAFLASFAIGYSGYQRVFAAPAAPVANVQTVARGTVTSSVAASGSVVTTKQTKLSFTTGGKLSSLSVNVGDSVKAGQTLAELDTTSLQIKLEQANSSLRVAQTKLEQLQASPKNADVAAAQASYASAVAKLGDLGAGPSDADLKSAQQSVMGAQANLEKAQNDLASLQTPMSQDDLTVAKAGLAKAQAVLQQAQGNYDKVAYRSDIGSRPEALALQQATVDYQSALATYNTKTAPPKQADVDLAQKNVDTAAAALASAQQRLDDLNGPPKASDVQSAQSAVASAKANLAAKTDPPTALDIALQQEQITQAQIGVKQAQIDLNGAKIVAPYDGVVAAISGNVGEQAGSGTAVVTLVDPKAIRIDATVDETDVAKVAVGKTAQITFDAIASQTFAGSVIAVAPTASVQQGVVSYLVSLKVDPKTYTLPNGITANVSIVVESRSDVLIVPSRAIRTVNRARVVDVQKPDGTTETRQVQVGLTGDQTQMTEITSGLSEGEKVVVAGTTAAAPRVGGGPGGIAVPIGGGFGR